MATYDWKSIWLFSAGASAIVLLLFLFTFSDKGEDAKPLPAESSDPLQVPI
jgi:hypothetical protein